MFKIRTILGRVIQMKSISLLCLLLLLSSCGGGGGGGDERRTRDTAVRIIHGSVDGAPVQITFDEEEPAARLKAAFAEGTEFRRVDSGPLSLNVERANSQGVGLGILSAQLEDETEYTIFVNGEARTGSIRATLLAEEVAQPEEGSAHVQLLHGVENLGRLRLRVAGELSSNTSRGGTTGFLTVPSGLQLLEAVNGDGGVVASTEVLIEDRSEVTLLVAGDSSLGFVTIKSFVDFD